MLRRLMAWFKVRFVFTNEQLLDTVYLIDRIDRNRLNDERLWKQSRDARQYIINELLRRGVESDYYYSFKDTTQ